VREDLYALKLEFNQETTTKTLEHSTQVGLQLSKNLLALSGPDSMSARPSNSVPQPFSTADWNSQKNDLQIYFQQELTIAERFNFFLSGELYPAISDPTVIPEWPTIDPQNQSIFNLEMEASYQLAKAFSVYSYVNREDREVLDLELGLSYQLTEAISIYGSVTQSLFPTDETDVNGNAQALAIDDTLKLGLSTTLFDGNLEAGLGVYTTLAQNVSLTDDENSELSDQLGQYTRRGIELSLLGELRPGWNLEAVYTYSQTQQPEVAPHSAELITTYEIEQGRFKGWGVTSSLVWENSFFSSEDNIQPTYLRADTGVFYRGRGFRAYLGLENLFAVDDEPWAIVGTIIVVF
jgi:TonB dependent receptor